MPIRSGLARLTTLLRSYRERESVRAVVYARRRQGLLRRGDLKGTGPAGFGGILGQAADPGHQPRHRRLRGAVIGCVHNYCVGLGMLLVGTCDVLIGVTGTRFVLAEVDNGATTGACRCWPAGRSGACARRCSPASRSISPKLAAYGSVYRVEPTPDAATATALAVAATIAAKAPRVVRAMKLALNNTARRDLYTLYGRSSATPSNSNMLGDARDARQTFLDGTRESYLNGAVHQSDPSRHRSFHNQTAYG